MPTTKPPTPTTALLRTLLPALLLSALLLATTTPSHAQSQNRTAIPDIDGFKTLQCDFHIHTVFSDGLVWPTVRPDEAFREGLDGIAITDHIEYRPHRKDIPDASHNRSNELAAPRAKALDIILIRGVEMTRNMPPGHFNAIFTQDSDALAKKDWRDSFAEAKRQNAFVIWNHPFWAAQQPNFTQWLPEHTEIHKNGWMHGIEIANANDYCPVAHQWCLDKKLTMIGNSDIHPPITFQVDFAKGEHRTITLVFAKNRTPAAIHDALKNRRTAVYYKEMLIGEEKYLRALYEKSVEVKSITRDGAKATVQLQNNSGLTFQLKKTVPDEKISYFRDSEIKPHTRHTINITLPADLPNAQINFEVSNLLIRPGKGLDYSYKLPDSK